MRQFREGNRQLSGWRVMSVTATGVLLCSNFTIGYDSRSIFSSFARGVEDALARKRLLWRRGIAGAAAIGFGVFVGSSPLRAASFDPANMRVDEIKALQQRLSDGGCYKGAIDGIASNSLDAAIKACPNQRPILRVETGMHIAPIVSLGVDADCRLLATASEDRTIRLWSLPEGKPRAGRALGAGFPIFHPGGGVPRRSSARRGRMGFGRGQVKCEQPFDNRPLDRLDPANWKI